ncbi:MAG: hypothetical protein FWC26_06530 [Fibromonadales bacterium]|nr:hypothetical protein [Fibromonadales bacterium]
MNRLANEAIQKGCNMDFYIATMKKVFVLLICLCGSALGQIEWDNPKCYEIDRIIDDLDKKWQDEKDHKYIAAMWSPFGNIFNKCKCVEKMACGKANLCISYKCPDDKIISFFEIDYFLENFNSGFKSSGFSSGSGAQPHFDK